MSENFEDSKALPKKLVLPKSKLASSKPLQEFEEVVGTPIEIIGNTVYFDGIGGVLIDDELFLKKTKEFVGKKIAILRTDLIDRPYLLMNVEVKQ